MDERDVIRKWTRSGSKFVEDELRESKRIKTVHFMVSWDVFICVNLSIRYLVVITTAGDLLYLFIIIAPVDWIWHQIF